MLQKLKNRSRGFTIIEVLIVLAIAGLIMVIVFIAVPALQRNQRNTARRSDASTLLSELSNQITNANGQVPSSCRGNSPGGCWVTKVNLGQYDENGADVRFSRGYDSTKPNDEFDLYIMTGAACAGADAVSSTNSRKTAAWFGLEGGSTACIES